MKRYKNILISLYIPFTILLIWLMVSSLKSTNVIIIPKPSDVFYTFYRFFSTKYLLNDIVWTLTRTILGFIIGSIIGIVLGIFMGTSKYFEKSLSFMVDAFRSIPATTLFPLFMLFFGLGLNSMIVLVSFPCCWLVTINTMYGVKNSSRIRKDIAIAYKLTSYQSFWHVTLPDASPSIAASLRLSIALCLHMAIIGEMFVGSESGIGRRLYDANLLLRIPEMYAIIILSGFIGYLLNQLFVIIEHKVFFWGGK
jgi:NitT/TauT family transport system permease protein